MSLDPAWEASVRSYIKEFADDSEGFGSKNVKMLFDEIDRLRAEIKQFVAAIWSDDSTKRERGLEQPEDAARFVSVLRAELARMVVERDAARTASSFEAERHLRNLLAVIHRDDGSHTQEVGLLQSVEDAVGVWADLMRSKSLVSGCASGEPGEAD